MGVRPPLAQAQTDRTTIEPAVNRVDIDFPRLITFSLEANLDREVDRVTLYYGTMGLSCQDGGARQGVTFEMDGPLQASWEWQLIRSRSIPPGTRLWWRWEIRAVDGTVWETAEQMATIEDEGPTWQTLNQDGVSVYWYRGDQAFGRALLNEALISLDRISETMGVSRPAEIQLWFYPSSSEVQEAVLNVPEWTGGVAFPEYGSTVLGVAPGQLDWASQIIPHELSHLVVGSEVFNCSGVRLPTWLSEGLARYAETLQDENDLKELERALENERLPSLRSLANGFSAYSNSASLSYTQSYQVVAFLIEDFGPERMNQLLETMRDGTAVDSALEAVYGFDTEGLDVAWRASRGYSVTPTPAAAENGQTTPTVVPTISFGLPVLSTPTPESTPTAEPTPTATATTPAPAAETPAVLEEEETAAAVAELPQDDGDGAAESDEAAVDEVATAAEAEGPLEPSASWFSWGVVALVGLLLLIVIGVAIRIIRS